MTGKKTESMQHERQEQWAAWLTLQEIAAMEAMPQAEMDAVLARLQRQADAPKFECRRRKHDG